jgi:hypothetical protein
MKLDVFLENFMFQQIPYGLYMKLWMVVFETGRRFMRTGPLKRALKGEYAIHNKTWQQSAATFTPRHTDVVLCFLVHMPSP